MSEELKLENYRPTMTADVLHSWAVDAQAELTKLRAELSAIKGGGEAGDQEDNIKHLTKCGDDGCERCENLMYFYQACDHCGTWGHNDAGPCSCSPPVVAEAEPVGRNWTEDFEHENGEYTCLCRECRNEFIGYKRRTICKACANAAPPASGAVPVLRRLVSEIDRVVTDEETFETALNAARALLAKGVQS